MVSLKPFQCMDLLKMNTANFDPLTETYSTGYYMNYMARWPQFFQKVEDSRGNIIAYIMGKDEGESENHHGHITALTVSPSYRGSGMGTKLLQHFEDISEEKGCYFVDLFVRKSNRKAINFYKRNGYIVYRVVLNYYPDDDAYDMRKALSRDTNNKSVVPLTYPIDVTEL